MWGGLPSAVSVEHVAVSWAVTCALYNGKIWVNMAEPALEKLRLVLEKSLNFDLIKLYEPCIYQTGE